MEDGQKTLLASELQEKLRVMIAEHGDRLVCLDDPDTGWLLGIDLETGEKASREPDPDVFVITATYYPPAEHLAFYYGG